MPEVPQQVDRILPATREAACNVVAVLTAMDRDLRQVADRRRRSDLVEGTALLTAATQALQTLADLLERMPRSAEAENRTQETPQDVGSW